jgi:hypothetical protein
VTDEIRDWLPSTVLEHAAIREKITAAVAEWASHWLGRPAAHVGPCRSSSGPAGEPSDGAPWRVHAAAVALSCPKKSVSRLLDLALDGHVDQLGVAPADRELLQAFERKLIGDLAVRAELALGFGGELKERPAHVPEPFDRLGGLSVAICDTSGGQLAMMAVPLRAAIASCRKLLPPRSGGREMLAPMRAVLGATAVQLDARLGKAEVSVTDLRRLSLGDVLVLDAEIEDGVRLTVGDDGRELARAVLTQAEGGQALSILA